MNAKNKIAKILQSYACLNAGCGMLLAGFLIDSLGGMTAFLVAVACLISSFLIYALGEIVELLNQIKENTEKAPEKIEEELPEI